MSRRFFIGSDSSGHEYLVPLDREAEWDAWCEIPETDHRSWEVPDFAERLDGGRLSFTEPQLNGVPL